MSKSTIIQIGIIIMILFVGYFTYSYLNKERMEDLNLNTKLKKTEEFNQKNDEKSEIQASNTILELSYKSSDDRGNVYEIKSISGAVNENDKIILFLDSSKFIPNTLDKSLLVSKKTPDNSNIPFEKIIFCD